MSREKREYLDDDFMTALEVYEKEKQKSRELSFLDWEGQFK